MDIDQGKLVKVQESLGWLQQADKHYGWLQFELADDCVKRAKAALADPVFDRQPIAGFARNQQPETVRVVATHLPQGFMIIESAAFDPTVHELYKEPTPPTSKRSK